MSKLKTVVALVLVCVFAASIPALAQLAASDWPKNKHDASNSGRSPATVIAKPSIKWQTSLSDGTYMAGVGSPSGPVIDSEGNIYVVDSGPGAVAKVSPSGAFLWRSTDRFGGGYWGGLLLTSDGQTLVGPGWGSTSPPGLYSLNPADGGTVWSVSFGNADSAPAVGPDGTIYSYQNEGWPGPGKLVAIDPVSKSIKWMYGDSALGEKPIGFNYGSPVVTTVLDGSQTKNLVIIAGAANNDGSHSIFAVRDDGTSATLLWSAVSGYHWNNPVLSNDGKTVYQAGFTDWGGDNLYAFDVASGALKWSMVTTGNHFSTPVIGTDGTLYLGGHNGHIVAIKDDGTSGSIKWTLDLPNDNGECTTPAVISSNPAVFYVGTSNSKFYAIKDNGSSGAILWKMVLCGAPTTPAVAADGTVYFQSGDKLVALEPGYTGPAAGKIKGYVKSNGGMPLAGAYVARSRSPRPLPDNLEDYVQTDSTGYYEFTAVPDGTYYVATWKKGWEASDDATVTISSSSPVATANFSLTRAGVNKAIGQLLYCNNPNTSRPPEAAVDANFGTWFESCGNESCRINTTPTYIMLDFGAEIDINETVIYWRTWPGEYKVQCLADGYGDPTFDETLWDTYGETIYSTSCGVGGIYFDPTFGIYADVLKFPTKTARYWRILATREGREYFMGIWEWELHSASERTGAIHGVIRNRAGNPIYNAIVDLNGITKIITDVSGTYAVTDLAPGSTFTVTADAWRYAARNAPFTIVGGLDLSADVVLADAPNEWVGYNWDFEKPTPGDLTIADGWYKVTGGTFAWLTGSENNHTPGGNACQAASAYGAGGWWGGYFRPTGPAQGNNFGWRPAKADGTAAYTWYYWTRSTAQRGASYSYIWWADAGGANLHAQWAPGLGPGKETCPPEPDWHAWPAAYRVIPDPLDPNVALGKLTIIHADNNEPVFYNLIDDVVFDEVQLSSTASKLSELKGLSDGCAVSLTGKIVTAAPGVGGVPAGVFYIEEPDRSSGIRVASTTAVSVGQAVSVTGTMATTPAGERYIEATSVTATAGTPVKPVASNTRNLAEYIMEGLLVKTAGTVRTVGADYYTIADGYFKDGVEVETKVVTGTAPGVTPGSFVTVKGAASFDGARVILKVP